ncbi:MAG: hypothetical protein CVU56_09015 [Deltaproteobacteria bacterium HGW-Deltaproteobacteria-14]|jgi:hypothetical protein|nr:MAG: hypothetical protein CVU56_09015 [Deltaproteobacteria bacterium HGW-Deltaproteobacteria-14]
MKHPSSRAGHLATLVGALAVGLGGIALEWQRFELAGVGARGYEVPLVAQIVLVLAALVFVAAALGIATRFRRRFGLVTLSGSLFLLGWVAAAHVSRAAGLPVMPDETITMGPGWYLAVGGAAVAAVGAVVALSGAGRRP